MMRSTGLTCLQVALAVSLLCATSTSLLGQVAQPSPESDVQDHSDSDDGHPSFLVPKTTRRVAETSTSQTPQTPQTMTTEVQLPVPQPIAEPPDSEKPQTTSNPEPDTQASTPSIIYGGQTKPGASATPVVSPASLLKAGRYEEVEEVATQKQDGNLARAIGWSFYNAHRYSDAEKWFHHAIDWNQKDNEAAYGLTLTLNRSGQYDQAADVARRRMGQYPNMHKVLGDSLMARAVAAYKAKQYQHSRELFEQTSQYRSLTRDERIVNAWAAFQAGDLEAAGSEFEQLYREKPDNYSASGVYAVCAKQQNWKKLEELSKTNGGFLADLYHQYQVQYSYDHQQYASAYAADPNKYPELQNYTSPSVSVSGSARFKSGNDYSKLREYGATVGGMIYLNAFNRISFGVGWTRLENGGVPPGSFVGQVPLVGPRTPSHNSPSTYGHLVDGKIGYEGLGQYAAFADVGSSAAGGELPPTVIGDIGIKAAPDWGKLSASFYRKSIQESILSYTGMRDPYSGKTWGRVTENAFDANLFVPLRDKWSVYVNGLAGVRDGDHVKSNDHLAVTAALGYAIPVPNFSYLTIGPSVSAEHYSRNLSYFTYGQGGYFSPDYLVQGTLGLQFMTKEGLRYLVRGSAAGGAQTYREDSTPIFPLENSSATYPAKDTTTFTGTLRLAGLYLLFPQLAAGLSSELDRTANYHEYSVDLFLKYFFEPRAGLFATDLE